MKYLVTGGAGFIGSNLTRALLASGQRVRVLDNFLTGKRENLAGLTGAHGDAFELVEGDLRDPGTVCKAAAGVEYVLHQGALPSVPRSVADPVLTNEINVAGTVNLLLAARDAGVRRVVFAASSSAYGDTPQLPKRESMAPNPKSPYAAQKLAGEHYLRIFYEIYGLETVSLRYFNVFGPRQDPGSTYAAVIPRFITSVLRGVPPTVYGDGLQTRDFTFIDNVIQANLAACAAPKAACGKVVNIACGERVSLLDILEIVYKLAGKRVPPKFEPARPGDVRDSLADISLAKDLIGYDPKVPFAEGLARTFDWFKSAEQGTPEPGRS
ncbi:MAG TPA: LPS biosynthesis protein WbpP [Deltaproteobacteria bacterium]|nr:MAG: Vi polysaccharide biosynthesis protein VipB/TviC [Deltaproteobacteria bacterium GWA2_65_63]OGP27920.1 MAG: Vi polysaccharide biosynthesis protein VipB/TviC [Deltaproteobacteria bacterium GWB2_65_81]OGP36864.1 MAG: Vi polysaccharide biosynthesis protein VipB/TviC [Deltaproteobacteria bacterium GWC2_66_88]OGP79341.1 MAG: Vi polysaccharide biosynthesis protein VipB/TviC [Deltaproteobacteria bacterium RBG_16_66_15]HBG73164.1 LPS biosynthesis protein WbpP [Deltaproteobacteria bacterium]